MGLSSQQIHSLARHGAAARVQEIQSEMAAIRAAFPGLGKGAPSAKREGRKPGRRGWTATQRRAAAARMKKYWAKKKAPK
jgi:hypothetical protein